MEETVSGFVFSLFLMFCFLLFGGFGEKETAGYPHYAFLRVMAGGGRWVY